MRAKSRLHWSLEGKLAALLSTLFLIAASMGAALDYRLHDSVRASLLSAGAAFIPLLFLAKRIMRPIRRFLRAMSAAVGSYRDGDFSVSLIVDRDDELGELLHAHNALGLALREQRSELAQRELLLEAITQNSPVALVLVDVYQRVVFANQAARNLLHEGRGLHGEDFWQVLQQSPQAMRTAASASEDCLFSARMNDSDEIFHLAQRSFLLQGQSHKLFLIKHMTREISRQETATWKKVIRVLSHELNNSLAPITSLAQSGLDVTLRGDPNELSEVFSAIGERAEHLHRFILGYASFSRLPAPHPEYIEWPTFIDEVAHQYRCRLIGKLPGRLGWFDASQMSQALINLLKNAHETGGSLDDVEIEVFEATMENRIEVRDRGPGMSEVVMSQALLPFYSTKRNGTGLGLVLVREITEAHGGHIRLSNRVGGGLCVSLVVPLPQSPHPEDDSRAQAN